MKFFVFLICIALVQANLFSSQKTEAKQAHDHDHDDMDWWEGGTFYQIYPRSFMDSKNDGDGDLNGITSKLPHLKDLGVTGAWLSPIFDSPMVDGGYDIKDFKNVNPMFGSNEDLEKLFSTAKELGLKIILDFVPNHTSDQHNWFIESLKGTDGGIYEDYYVWQDGLPNPAPGNSTNLPPNNWLSVFSGAAWTYNEGRKQYYLHQFAKEQPDLNFRNPRVVEEMKNVLT